MAGIDVTKSGGRDSELHTHVADERESRGHETNRLALSAG